MMIKVALLLSSLLVWLRMH